MTEPANDDRAARFVKALANETRLRIVGCLSLGPLTRSELATKLGLRPEELTRHIGLLSDVGLIVEVLSRGMAALRLETAWLRAGNPLTQAFSRGAASDSDSVRVDSESKTLAAFVRDGRIVRIPVAAKKQLVLLRWLVERFEDGQEYPEREVNVILKVVHPDFAALRRMLVDNRFMRRDHGIYRREDQSARTG